MSNRYARTSISVGVILQLILSVAWSQQTFEHPQVDDLAMDWCLNRGTDCGKPAADRFCHDHGFTASSRFQIAQGIGPTRILSTHEECGPSCDGFLFIECSQQATNQKLSPSQSALRSNRIFKSLLPSGAKVWYQDGDIAMSADFAAHGRSIRLYWNVDKIPNAVGVMWQVNQVSFESVPPTDMLHPAQIASSGMGSGKQGSFLVDFASIPRPSPEMIRGGGSDQPLWYVRLIPVGPKSEMVGQLSNVIRVYDQKAPSSGPDFKINQGEWYVKPGMQIHLARFEFVPYRYFSQWPSGCEVYKGAGYQQTPWGWASGAFTDGFDWTSTAYKDMKNSVITGVVTLLPFVPRDVASAALDAALASAGIPPNVPNLDQLMGSGADYLASQMTDQLAAQVPAGSPLLQLGKEELRKEIQQKTRDALIQKAKQMRADLASKSKYCTEMEYPPYVELVIQNASEQTYRDIKISIDAIDMEVWSQEHFLRGLPDFMIDQLNPGESQTIPVDIFSRMNVNAVPEDKTTSYSEKDIGHWMQRYRQTEFRFVVSGGKTLRYRAMSENGTHLEEIVEDDGSGFSYTTPKQTWMIKPFLGP